MTHAGRAASSPEIFRPFLTVCLTVFPFEFRPRTFTIGFYGKKSFISELMILECSFPLTVFERFLSFLGVGWGGGGRKKYSPPPPPKKVPLAKRLPCCPWAGSGVRTFRSAPPATFVSQLRSLSLDEYNQNRLVISATCPKHLNERLRNPSLKRSSYHGNGERVYEMALRDRCIFSPRGCHIMPKMLFLHFMYCLAQALLLLQVMFP